MTRAGQHASTPRSHGATTRGLDHVAGSRLDEGRFGRMFRRLPAYLPDDERIAAVAAVMAEPSPPDPAGDNDAIPAGYTYIGQFVDHDLTFDPVSSLERRNDPDALTNFRTPRFDLDSVYGRGPRDQPYLYDQADGRSLLVGEHDDLLDLPRNGQDTALIGDPRNDENVFVSHVHLTMLLFHNRVVARLGDFPEAAPQAGEDAFAAAQRVVRWHYQWAVVHDFLRRIVGEDTFDDVLPREPLVRGGREVERPRLRFFNWNRQPFMPVEFSVAAYRFGHSMIRAGYKLNTTVPGLPVFTSEPIGEADPLSHFGGFRRLPPFWQIEWRRFFEIEGKRDPDLQPTRAIDVHIAPPLLALPPEEAPGMASLVRRNLVRGARLGLPSGQAVARAMGVEPLSGSELGLPGRGPAPLWYYVLREAQVLAGGRHLGPVGGRIVAEVFLGLLAADPSSYLRTDPGWRPFLPGAEAGDFTVPDLITFTGFGLDEV
ncbi:peroxidase family protein [Allonocardiopsis opalescens]|uniref:Heme peroxidase n=1 Tax=Allonocardiopsis opalescens TaxID=1144618 RepID=A0A2T0QE86_9ACTN|nr:heme peroxidase family protein [Allonocardiopsis opalescens]PRY02181.1 heme peroxidase [Allonocardiopsis opalescens]